MFFLLLQIMMSDVFWFYWLCQKLFTLSRIISYLHPPYHPQFDFYQIPQAKATKMHTNKVKTSHATNFIWCTLAPCQLHQELKSITIIATFSLLTFCQSQLSKQINHHCLSKFWWFQQLWGSANTPIPFTTQPSVLDTLLSKFQL